MTGRQPTSKRKKLEELEAKARELEAKTMDVNSNIAKMERELKDLDFRDSRFQVS